MVEDHFTKMLQVELFRNFIVEVINIPMVADLANITRYEIDAQKWVTWKIYDKTDQPCTQKCVGDYADSLKWTMDFYDLLSDNARMGSVET